MEQLEIVNKEIALELKELGFNFDEGENKVSLPTQALVIRWFEKEHNIIIHPDYHYNGKFGYFLYTQNETIQSETIGDRDEAEEAGILKAIEILKEKENNG